MFSLRYTKLCAMIMLASGLLISLPSCSKKKIKSQNPRLHYEEKKEHISLHAYKMNSRETKKKFGRDLTDYGYRPVSLVIFNDSDDELVLRASSFDIKLEKASVVTHAAHIPTAALSIVPATMAGLFFWPALIPVCGMAMWMADRNKMLAENIAAQILEGDVAVQIFPYERLEKIIFVKNERIDQISFHLFNVHKKSFIPFVIEFNKV